MSFGALGNSDAEDCARIVHAALAAGVNFVDTADMYSAGESERIVGKALMGRRERVVLATKCFWPMGPEPNQGGLSRHWITRAVEQSLERLSTDWIDVYFMHKPDWSTDLEESLAAMTDLVRSGKVRAIGMSTYPAEWLVEAQWIAERRHLVRPTVEQPPFSILVRSAEQSVFPTCLRHGMGVMVWGPLCSGWLTGKYQKEAAPSGSRAERWGGAGFDRTRDEVRAKISAVQALGELADSAGISLGQLATAFSLSHPAVTSTIIGPRSFPQLEETLGWADARLENDVLEEIDRIVPPGKTVDSEDDWYRRVPWLENPGMRRRTSPL
jgi:aryl-alcohol dehydrogenase-like predicted oxidoreductase